MGIVSHKDEGPVTESDEPTSVYRYFDQQGILLYVGITKRGITRNLEHNGVASWWPYVTSQKVFHVDSREQALKIERDLIRRYRPPFNRQHNSGADDLREAYLRYASSPPVEEQYNSAGHIILPQRIRLHPLAPLKNGALVMRTDPADAVAARRFEVGDQKPHATVRSGRSGQVMGGVYRVERRGDLALILMKGRNLEDASGAWLYLKKAIKPPKQDFTLTAKRVFLEVR